MITLPEIEVTGVCHDCRRKHVYRVARADLAPALGEWTTKHQGHVIAFSRPRPIYQGPWRSWLHQFWNDCPLWAPGWFALGHGYGHNADVKGAYVTSANYTITLASLASSSSWTAGRESDAINNGTNKYLDYLIGGKVTTGTSPAASSQINIGVYAAYNDTPDYPDVMDGTDSAETWTSANVMNAGLTPLKAMLVDSTSDRSYFMAPVSLAAFFGTLMPPQYHGLFAAHNTTVNLNATGSNHELSYTGLYGTVA